jgi:uncharacterized protein YrrD
MNDRFNQENEPLEETRDQGTYREADSTRRGSAQVFQVGGDEESIDTQSIKGRAVVSIQNGKKVGSVSDVVIDADRLQLAALVLTRGTLFDRDKEMIPAEQVQVWGEDVILIKQYDVIDEEMRMPEGKRWLYADENLRGRYVVSVDGKRIGQINDIVISPDGKLLAYQLSQVYIEGPLSESKRIDVSSTHSLGEDVLIVNSVQNL